MGVFERYHASLSELDDSWESATAMEGWESYERQVLGALATKSVSKSPIAAGLEQGLGELRGLASGAGSSRSIGWWTTSTRAENAANVMNECRARVRVSLVAIALVGLCLGASAQKVMPIHSGAMAPTFALGDSLEINLFAYTVLSPARWDIVTYKSPNQNYFLTHRVVGIPGDTVAYDRNKVLRINGVPVVHTRIVSGIPTELPEERIFLESLEGAQHLIQLRDRAPGFRRSPVDEFLGSEQCTFGHEEFSCVVPAEHYFVMGDNRDSSRDSRDFGFVPEGSIGGRVENATVRPFRR